MEVVVWVLLVAVAIFLALNPWLLALAIVAFIVWFIFRLFSG